MINNIYVVFTNSDNKLLRFFLRDGFQHVIYLFDLDNDMFLFEVTNKGLNVHKLTSDKVSKEAVITYYLSKGRIVKVKRDVSKSIDKCDLFFNCVGFGRDLFNIRRWIFTPYKLWTYLTQSIAYRKSRDKTWIKTTETIFKTSPES